MRNTKKIISLLIALAMLTAGITIPVSAATNTPLFLIRDTIDSYKSGISVTGTGYGNSIPLINGVWETSAILGGTGSLNSYGTYTLGFTGRNTVIGLTPSTESDGNQCVLNLTKDIENAENYTYSVDMKMNNNLAGIRLANTLVDNIYYELALTTDDSSSQARFSKVRNALYDTPIHPEDFLYVDYSESKSISPDHWLTLSLSKKENTFYWLVSDKTTGQTLFNGSYEDASPFFKGIGKLQLFSCCVGNSPDLTLFDNVYAKKLGSVLYKADGDTTIEVSWINSGNKAPIIATADYDEQDRLLEVETFDNVILDNSISDGEIGYLFCKAPFNSSAAYKKLFIWDSQTMQPYFDTPTFESAELAPYNVPAEYYVHQFNRATTFIKGGGILFTNGETIDVSPDAKLYINEYEYTAQEISDEILDKFLGNAQGNICFKKSTLSSSQYDRIYIDYYIVGTVNSVIYADDKTTVTFTPVADDSISPELNITAPITITVTDTAIEDGLSNIYAERNSRQISLNQLCDNDIIAVYTNYEALVNSTDYTITNPAEMTVLATNKTIQGMVVDYDNDLGTYTVGETTYKYVGFDFNSTQRELFIATTYDLVLDPFGRIVDGTVVVILNKFAIIERTSTSGEEKVTLLLEDGTTATYEISARGNLNSASAVDAFIMNVGNKKPPQDRVVTYKIRSDNTVVLNTLDANSRTNLVDKEYNPNTCKLGSVTITDEVKMIDASNYVRNISEYSKFDASELKPKVQYTAYAYKTGDVYSFIILSALGKTFTEDSRFAVVTRTPSNKIYDGASCMGTEVLYKGEHITLYWDTTVAPTHTDGTPINEGDVMFFTTDADGYVSDSYKIYDRQDAVFSSTIPESEIDITAWSEGFADSTANIQLVNGVVTEVTGSSITFGVIENGVIDGNTYDDPTGTKGMYTFGITDECNAYMFDGADGSPRDYQKYSTTYSLDIVGSDLIEQVVDGVVQDCVYDVATSTIHNAVAMIVDGDVVDIFIEYPEM
ncbi:MAG: hypothetical protein E7417_03950 [Ruminococcaceae bacterium]|nr:hypothetical protein [Oscillospiraceae bacterium]